MKKLSIMLWLIILSSFVYGQKGLHFGYAVAPQTTWMFNSDNSDNPNFRFVSTWRLAHGAHVFYNFNETVGVGIDIVFSQQGQRFELYRDVESQHDGSINRIGTNYIKIPLLIRFSSDPEKTVMFQGKFGPQFAILTKAELELKQETGPSIMSPDPSPGTYDVSDDYESLNIGVVLGFGMGIHITDDIVGLLQLRFDFSFTDAEDKDAESPWWDYYYADGAAPASPPTFWDSDLTYSNRPSTFHTTGGIEIGLRYILRSDN